MVWIVIAFVRAYVTTNFFLGLKRPLRMNADGSGKQSMKGSLPRTRANVNNEKKKIF